MLLIGLLLLTRQNLPELDDFLLKTKAHLLEQYDESELRKGYTYRLKTIHEGGKIETTEHDVFHLEKGRYLKLISKVEEYSDYRKFTVETKLNFGK